MTNYLIITALYRFICLAYLILCLAIRSKNKMMHLTSINESSPPKSSVKLIHYFMSMLMWPILGTINFMLPTLTTYKGGEVHEVALLDSVLGIGMAVIGVLFSKFISNKWMHLLFILSIVITISWYVLEDILLFKLVLMLLFGLTFGGARIIFQKNDCYNLCEPYRKTHLFPGKCFRSPYSCAMYLFKHIEFKFCLVTIIYFINCITVFA
ncbi:hypothetical protein QI050_10980 [Staphylococcus saprophyticus]|nr:hypothetical protein [Staphylococcus saprophyticus]MDW4426175.1 hypothetical protein [Staphylococcus saprophyticus]